MKQALKIQIGVAFEVHYMQGFSQKKIGWRKKLRYFYVLLSNPKVKILLEPGRIRFLDLT